LRQLTHRSLAAGEIAKHVPAGGVAKRVKDRVHLGRL
jgi:hypothetical protein